MLCSCKGILDIAPPAKGLTVETRAHAILECSKARSSYWPRPTVKKEAKRPLEKGFRFRVSFRFFRP